MYILKLKVEYTLRKYICQIPDNKNKNNFQISGFLTRASIIDIVKKNMILDNTFFR